MNNNNLYSILISNDEEDTNNYIVSSSDISIIKILYNKFSVDYPNKNNIKSVKDGIWDGKIRFYNKNNNKIKKGLIWKLIEIAKKIGCEIHLNKNVILFNRELKKDKLISYIDNNFLLSNKPHDFQYDIVFDLLKYKRITALSITGSGKSYAIYLVICLMLLKKHKTLLIVPDLGLLHQMQSDLLEYSNNSLTDYIQTIHKDSKIKTIEKDIIITTWQSGNKKSINELSVIDCVIGDEIHIAKAKNYNELVDKCTKSKYRIGLTGTLPNKNYSDWYKVVSVFGRVKEYNNYKLLQDRQIISNFDIFVKILNYTNDIKLNFFDECGNDYRKQLYYLSKLDIRSEYISSIIDNNDSNTLIICSYVENEAKNLKQYIGKRFKNKKDVFYIDGSLKAETRENIRKDINKQKDCVLIASVQTLAVGINIRNLKNIIIATSFKSFIRLKQSIGRIIRIKTDGGNYARVFDIVDNMCYYMNKHKKINHGAKQYIERKLTYQSENFNIIEEKINL